MQNDACMTYASILSFGYMQIIVAFLVEKCRFSLNKCHLVTTFEIKYFHLCGLFLVTLILKRILNPNASYNKSSAVANNIQPFFGTSVQIMLKVYCFTLLTLA
jgi:hypothetical protein